MNQWTPEKRRQIGLLAVGALAAMVFLYLTLVSYLQSALTDARMRLEVARRNLELTETGMRQADRTTAEKERNRYRLQNLEQTMASGDLFMWAVNGLRPLLERHNLPNPHFDPPQPASMPVPPAVPYGALDYYVDGWGSFSDLGSFLMDLENEHPFARLNSLSIQASAPGLASARERQVNFRLSFSCLTQTRPEAQ